MSVALLRPPDAASDAWRDELGAAFAGLRPEPFAPGPETAPTTGRIEAATLGDVATFRILGSPQAVRRSRSAARADGHGPLKLCLQVRGSAVLHQGGNELTIGPGRLTVYDTAQAYDLRLDGDWECSVMTFPAAALGLPLAWLPDLMARTYDTTTGPGSVLRSFIETSLSQFAGDGVDPAGLRFGDAGLALLASTLTSDRLAQAGDRAGGEAGDEARRLQIAQFVRRHLHDPSLCHSTVATAHAMSSRSLDRLYALEPATVATMIRTLRLEGARRELLDPRAAHHSLNAVAARWCFPQPAHFTRAFKARFGTTPGELQRREAAIRTGTGARPPAR